jgi:hypothetical protein
MVSLAVLGLPDALFPSLPLSLAILFNMLLCAHLYSKVMAGCNFGKGAMIWLMQVLITSLMLCIIVVAVYFATQTPG